MTGLYGSGNIGDLLARLLGSNEVKHLASYGSGKINSLMPQIGGPLRSGSSGGSSQPGAAPRSLGQWVQPQDNSTGINGALGAVANFFGQGQDPLQALYQQLLGQLTSPVGQPQAPDQDAIMRRVQAAINPIYDTREENATNTTNRGTQQVGQMYKALADDYKQLAPQQVAQAAQNKKQIEDLYGQLKTNIQGDYSRVSKEQGDLFKSLGIESALPDVLAKQNPGVEDALTSASQTQTQQEQRYQDIGNIDQQYFEEGATNAPLTGNNIATSMVDKLQDYINQAEGERTAGIQSAFNDQYGQAQSQYQTQLGQANQETNQHQSMLWQILQSQMNQKSQPVTSDSFLGSLPPQVAQQVGNAYTSLERSPEAVYGKVEDPRSPVPGTFVQTTPEWYMQQADEMFKQGQIDAATHQALLMYLQLQLKQ